jgi:3-hydroxyacyl-CoA dehydrogenase/enoyl-CoA hydratase/3-hydroxybutyryl-CoA epimerase
VRRRLLYIQAIETARCLEEGVLMHPADGDIGSVLAWSFPTYTGGTLSLIDTVGIQRFVTECEELADLHGERFRPSSWLKARAAKGQAFYA